MPVGKCLILKHYKTTEKLPDYLQVARFFPAQGLIIRKGRTVKIPIVCQKKEKMLIVATFVLKVSQRGWRKNAVVESIATNHVLANALIFKAFVCQSLSWMFTNIFYVYNN